MGFRKTGTAALFVVLAFMTGGCGQKESAGNETPAAEVREEITAEVEREEAEETAKEEAEETTKENPEEEAEETAKKNPEEESEETAKDDLEGTQIVQAKAENVYVASAALSGEELKALENETAALYEAPANSGLVLEVSAPGTLVQSNESAVIDYSNTADGYVMVQFTAATQNRLKVQVKGPSTTYTYNLKQGQWTAFPFSDGNGSYQISVFQNVVDNKYSNVLSHSVNVTLKDEFAPFLRPNQYVDYTAGDSVVAKAAQITSGMSTALEKVAAVYDFVIGNVTYDKEKAASVQSGYLPVLTSVLEQKKGICFDYAALMTAMLRSQQIPCKLVVGYAGQAYHAWISVWTAEEGWIDSTIYFDGSTWHRMDPTFASSANQSASISEYIGDGSNYTVKYLY